MKALKIKEEQYRVLKEFSDLTGRPVEDLVTEALENFVEADLTSHMEAIANRTASA
jgi:predicted DNA-binding protein